MKKSILAGVLAMIFMMGMQAFAGTMQLPDTGQTKCYNNSVEIACPSPGQAFYGQDAQYNLHPRSYTKLDAAGNVLPDSAASWTMVKDNVTGLIWENKTDDGTIHDKDKTFTWCDTNPATNGGNQGTCGAGTGDASTDTQAFINALNAANYGGHNDWRMPTIKELSTLVNSSISSPGPTIDAAWFPNTNVSSSYWSSTTIAYTMSNAWLMVLSFGAIFDGNGKSTSNYVRAVRGGQHSSSLTDKGDGTVTDASTGLMWQQATAPGTYTWEQALAYVATLNSIGFAGYTDWRLPDRNELQSLVDYSRYSPAIGPQLAADTLSSYYWSATTVAYNTSLAWLVYFRGGDLYGGNKSSSYYYVRAVRAGQSGSFLYASFTNAGIWQWGGSGWAQLTPDNPETMVAAGSNLYGKFSNGIWQWTGSGWNKLTPDKPAEMVAAGSNLYGNFTGAGIWQWNGSGWSQLTPDNPESMVAAGSNLYGKFANGIWQWTGSGWNKLTPDKPAEMVAAGSNMYGSFTGSGIWQWNGSGWSLLTPDIPEAMSAAGSNLYGKFGNGIWQWSGSGWSKLTPDKPASMASAGSNLYGSFTGNGIWQWNGSGWSQLTPDNPAIMAVGE